MNQFLLSVVIPVYNVEKFLSRCLDSILDQELPHSDYEILLINDGSTDTSLNIAEKFKSRYPNIVLITVENGGVSEARNIGIKMAKGEYIYFMDADDYLERKVFKNLIDIALKLKLDFLGFDFTKTPLSDYQATIDFSGLNSGFSQIEIFDGISFISKYNYSNTVWWGFINRELLIKNPLFFEKGRMSSDSYYIPELLLNCNRIVYLKVDIYRYFKNMNSIINLRTKNHVLKLNEDHIFAIFKFTEIINLAKRLGADKLAIERLMARQESIAFYLLIRMIRTKLPFDAFCDVITKLKEAKVYPLKNFIGKDYNAKREKVLTAIFNNKTALWFLLQTNSILKVIK